MWTKKELVDKKVEFWVLMAQGSTLIAACEAVGVDRRSGRHWRQATGGRIPRKRPAPSGRYLSLEERLRIADLHLAGETMSKIAADLSRAVSTVSRELTRNAPTAGPRGRPRGKYAPYGAETSRAARTPPQGQQVRQS
jgi:DNA-binding NarL/FixJ family response regulator